LTKLTHFNARGQAHMVDVGGKDETHRIARAGGSIAMKRATLAMIAAGGAKKGDVLGIARIAAIQGAKRAAELIPLAHPLALTRVEVEFAINAKQKAVTCIAQAETRGRTGVEMEALTIYDMCKSVDRGMRVEDIRLLEKKGGKSGHWIRKPRT